jgi:hypothetical protein
LRERLRLRTSVAAAITNNPTHVGSETHSKNNRLTGERQINVRFAAE